MPDLTVEIRIARPPDVVRRWWLEFPEVYENSREQPHRIVTRSRSTTHIDTLTYWRGPLGRVSREGPASRKASGRAPGDKPRPWWRGGELEVPERFTLRPDGWDVDITLPFGLAQRDVFTLTPDGDGTKVRIAVDVWARTAAGKLARPFFMPYARRNYPATWRAAVTWCERATAQSV